MGGTTDMVLNVLEIRTLRSIGDRGWSLTVVGGRI
jgi:hypothetical protein